MKGVSATGQADVTEFVIVTGSGTNTKAWKAPRNWTKSKYSGWTSDPDSAFVYKSWQSANRAIERYRRYNRPGFESAQYCTFGEWLEIMKGSKNHSANLVDILG